MMDRRNFLEGVAASIVLTITPGVARAVVASSTPASSVLIVYRSDLREAASLAASMDVVLHGVGIKAVQFGRNEGQLTTFAHIDAALRLGRGGRVVGVMDDASAVLFQQIAAAQGGGFLVETQHRFDGVRVRHRSRRTDGSEDLCWSDRIDGWTPRMARRHVDVIVGRPTSPIGAEPSHTGGSSAGLGLVSFVITL